MSNNRLNGIIRAWEQGKPAFTAFSKIDKQSSIDMSDAPYDGIVYEMEHNPYDVSALGDSLQYLLNRKQIATAGSLAPAVTPLARIPANGVEMNQSFAKQVLDRGVYGVITPHVATVEQAYNAVASCRYARPKNAPLYEPKGVRGDGPMNASRYWGLTQAEYYAKADVWPLAPQGELLVGLMIESTQAIENLDDMLANVPGVGFC
jgi:4-hydroxy-2-oxoheptanedioate aldolase